ncbi:hypothetical protein CF319_g5876 [Tilletia indica]|nr:hypothetical protein CF319_g5876 [Tilletia indica]
MDPVDSDSSSFTWSALNADSDSLENQGGSGRGGQGGRPGSGGGSGSNNMDLLSNGASPLQIVPAAAVVNTSLQATQPAVFNRPPQFVTTRTVALPTTAVRPTTSSAVRSSPSVIPRPIPTTSGLSPAAMASLSSALASAVAASSLSASLAVPSNHAGPLKNITSDASAGDTSPPVPLRRNAPLLLLLVLGCLVGAATIMASLAWLCRMTDSRKRAKKKARLNQASWDPDASSSVFDGASSSLMAGGGSSLFGPTTAVDVMPITTAERGAGAKSSWWMLGENSKRTSSPSLMDYDDEKFDAERENSSGIFIDSLPADPVSIPATAAMDPGRPHRGASARQHRRTGSMLSGLGMPPSPARNLPSLVVSSHHHGSTHSTPPGLPGSRFSLMYSNDYPSQNDPYTRLRTPGLGPGPGGIGRAEHSIARLGTPVLSPLLNQIMHSGGAGASEGPARPGTPLSLMAGRVGGRGFV